jgi:hypothetical protein
MDIQSDCEDRGEDGAVLCPQSSAGYCPIGRGGYWMSDYESEKTRWTYDTRSKDPNGV